MQRPSDPLPDPNELLRGECPHCRTLVEVERRAAVVQRGPFFAGTLWAECPNELCRARSPKGIGAAVQVAPAARPHVPQPDKNLNIRKRE